MKGPLLRALLFVAGLALICWGMLPTAAGSVLAAPLMLVTETSTAEPPTPTNPPPPTPTDPPPPTPTEIGELTPGPTNTPPPAPTNTPPPENTPLPTDTPQPTEPPDDDRPRPSATPTASPSPTEPPASPTAEPANVVADPAINKTVSPGTAAVGSSVTYTIIVSNIGGSVATGVVVDDTLPSFVTPTGATTSKGEASVSGQAVRVTIGDLAPGETVTVTVSARVNATASAPNNRNLAVVSSTSPDGNPNNNQSSVPLDTPVPVTLPSTGDDGRGVLPLAAMLLGLALVVASVAIRRRTA